MWRVIGCGLLSFFVVVGGVRFTEGWLSGNAGQTSLNGVDRTGACLLQWLVVGIRDGSGVGAEAQKGALFLWDCLEIETTDDFPQFCVFFRSDH